MNYELDDETEWDDDSMPVPCQKCWTIFDLNDGVCSDKWFVNTVICERCAGEETTEIELDNEIEELKNAINDAYDVIDGSKVRLEEIYKTYKPD